VIRRTAHGVSGDEFGQGQKSSGVTPGREWSFLYSAGTSFREIELMQYRRSVGVP
jgi:hypothetical protein